MPKSIFTSKTVWFNVFTFLIAILALPEFVHILPPAWLQYDILGGSVGNLILRVWFTSQPITPTSATA